MTARAYVTSRVWIDESQLDPTARYFIKNDCTVIPSVFRGTPKPVILYERRGKWIGIPRMYFRNHWLKKSRASVIEDHSKLKGGDPVYLRRDFTLRPEDQAIDVPEFVRKLQAQGEWGGGLFSAYTGYGKSVSICEMIAALGGPSIIIVHQKALLHQWKKTIARFLPDARVGIVQGKIYQVEGKDVVIASAQSIWSEGKYNEIFYQAFRTVIVDEVHRFGAKKFSDALKNFNCRYTIGTSGTIRRKDGAENVFKFMLGETLVKGNEINRIRANIYFRETHAQLSGREGSGSDEFGKEDDDEDSDDLGRQKIFGILSSFQHRNTLIARDILTALKSGRHPIVMAESLVMLNAVAAALRQLQHLEGREFSHGFFIGDKTGGEQDFAASQDVVFATIQLAREGIDIERLDTLFLLHSVGDPEQIIGRICRKKGKHEKSVIYYADSQVQDLRGSLVKSLKLLRDELNWECRGYQALKVPVIEEKRRVHLQYGSRR